MFLLVFCWCQNSYIIAFVLQKISALMCLQGFLFGAFVEAMFQETLSLISFCELFTVAEDWRT